MPTATSTGPRRAGLVFVALIIAASVANMNLAVANVALPSIGQAFGSSQTALDLVSVGYSLGLAMSVLYLGALGDRFGRKSMLIGGMALSIPASILAATAPSIGVLVLARILGGVAAGMAYPTTLSLIMALWSGRTRTRYIALWSGIGGAMITLGVLIAGAVLLHFSWSSAFLITLPLAAVALVLTLLYVPSHVNETTDPVDNLGGILSVVLVAALVLAINFAPTPNRGALALGLAAIALAAGVGFFMRQRRARMPLFELKFARRRTFWVAAGAGIIVFGTLMGAMYVGSQFLQDVLGYSTFESGLATLPIAVLAVVAAPFSARLVAARGARVTLIVGFALLLLGFLTMLFLWREGVEYWPIGMAFALIGMGVGFAGTPASSSLTNSVPVNRAGMASGTADLERDLGGAIMQSIMGALLTAGYASTFAKAIAGAGNKQSITDSVQSQLEKSFAGAASVAERYPKYASEITATAKSSFLSGADWAYGIGVIAVALGIAAVFLLFPKQETEEKLLARYQSEDA